MSTKVTLAPLRLTMSQGALYAYWEKPIPKVIEWTFLLFVVTIPLEGLDLPFFTSQGITLPKLFGFLFFCSYMAKSGLPLKLSLPPIPSALWWFLGYLIIFAASGLMAGDTAVVGIRQYVIRILTVAQQVVLLWFAADFLRDGKFARKSLITFVTVCAFVAVGALLGLPGFGSDSYQDRVSAFDASPNDIGPLMAYAAIVSCGFYLIKTGWSGKRKLLLIVVTIPILGLMVASGSRAAMAAFFMGMTFFFVPHRRSRRMMLAFGFGAAVIAAVLFFILHDPTTAERWTGTITQGETAGRWPIYAAAWQMFEEKPLLGWGGLAALDELGFRLGLQHARDAHNFVLYLLIQVGLVGTIPFLVALWFCLKAAWKARVYQFGLVPLSVIIAVLTYGMAHTGIRAKVFWLILGFVLAASAAGRDLRVAQVTGLSTKGPPEPKGT
jgi:O-antigen ligase